MLDRGDLPYLNVLERFNCFYCGYANGLMGYSREVAARTEQYFCPIKHARRVRAAHDRYPTFFEYGDADSYRLGLERLRDSLAIVGETQQGVETSAASGSGTFRMTDSAARSPLWLGK